MYSKPFVMRVSVNMIRSFFAKEIIVSNSTCQATALSPDVSFFLGIKIALEFLKFALYVLLSLKALSNTFVLVLSYFHWRPTQSCAIFNN